VARFVEATRGVLDGGWPGAQAAIWRELVEHLRPDKAGKEERKVLIRLLRTDATGVRARFLDLLKATEETWYESRSKGRNASERAVLRAVKSSLADSAEDGLIGKVLAAIESFEQASAAAQSAFDTVRVVPLVERRRSANGSSCRSTREESPGANPKASPQYHPSYRARAVDDGGRTVAPACDAGAVAPSRRRPVSGNIHARGCDGGDSGSPRAGPT